MSIVDSLYNRIDEGRKGANIGIPTGLPELDKYTYGIQRRWLTVVGADSGAGKTTYVLFTHVYQPLKYALEHPETEVDILFFSLEMSSEVLYAKLLSLYIFDHYHKEISFSSILSLDSVLNDEDYNLICEAREWVEKIDKHLYVYSKMISADGVYTVVRSWLNEFGTFEEINEYTDKYIPKNPNAYRIVVIDHMRLLAGTDKRVEINKCADNLIKLRDQCDLTIALVQQLNRQLKSSARRDSGYFLIQTDDFADASGPVQAAETVIGIYYPHREKRHTCEGYDIKTLRDRARIIQVLKSRYGTADVMKAVLFRGETGYYKELPKPEAITDYQELLTQEYMFKDIKDIPQIKSYESNKSKSNKVEICWNMNNDFAGFSKDEAKEKEEGKQEIEATSTQDLLNFNSLDINFKFD